MQNLGIIGSNFVADWLCDAVKLSAGIRSHAVYSRTAERGNEFAAKHGIPNVYTDLEAFLSSDIDAVYIASPNFLHFPQAMAAMEHGKHVLVEKPAALSAAQFAEMRDCAKKNGVVLIEAMRPAHDEALAAIRESLGKIGTVRRAVLEFCQYSSRYDKFRAGEVMNAFNPALGNAAVMDIGVYAIEVAVLLFGSPKDILSRSVILHNGMEGMGTAFLDYPAVPGTNLRQNSGFGGAQSHDGEVPAFQVEIVYSKITHSVTPSVITGEDGSLKLGKLSTLDSLTYCPRGGEETVIFEGREDGTDGNMVYEVADFVKMIAGDMDAAPYQDATAETLRIIDEIRRQNGIEFR